MRSEELALGTPDPSTVEQSAFSTHQDAIDGLHVEIMVNAFLRNIGAFVDESEVKVAAAMDSLSCWPDRRS